jgi:hypothetical protein
VEGFNGSSFIEREVLARAGIRSPGDPVAGSDHANTLKQKNNAPKTGDKERLEPHFWATK